MLFFIITKHLNKKYFTDGDWHKLLIILDDEINGNKFVDGHDKCRPTGCRPTGCNLLWLQDERLLLDQPIEKLNNWALKNYSQL